MDACAIACHLTPMHVLHDFVHSHVVSMMTPTLTTSIMTSTTVAISQSIPATSFLVPSVGK